jgi:large subunit ribosomal protein L16
MLQPKRSKHRKMQKGRMKGDTKRGDTISFGTFGLKALDSVWLTNRQIEMCGSEFSPISQLLKNQRK